MGFFQTFVKNKGGKFKFLGKGAVPNWHFLFSEKKKKKNMEMPLAVRMGNKDTQKFLGNLTK